MFPNPMKYTFLSSSETKTRAELLEPEINFPLESSCSSGLQTKSGRGAEEYQKKYKSVSFSRATKVLSPPVKTNAWFKGYMSPESSNSD